METLEVDLCIIGAGSGGLSVAASASQMGLKVALIEKDKMGGDCLNYGCVPSKSLLAAAKKAHTLRHIEKFGIANVEPQVNYFAVKEHVHRVIANIAPHDSADRFVGLGVIVIRATARFISRNEVSADDRIIKAKRFVIAAGSQPAIPPIPGLENISYFTNETIFDLDQKPDKLIVIGGGPIGCELAQAHRLLGAEVTVLEMFKIMPKDDPELVAIVREQLIKDGIVIHEDAKIVEATKKDSGIEVTFTKNDQQQTVSGSHLLIATGRKVNVEGLDLEKAGIDYTSRGIKVDARLRTSNKRIYAIGDIAGSYQFTHAASYHAGVVIRNALFHLPAKVNYSAMPWVTYTLPELAHVGQNEQQAREQGLNFRVIKQPFSEVDRSQAEADIVGMIKVIATPKGQILGVSIVGSEAGELIVPWILAIQKKLKLSAMAGLIVPYPTRSDISKQVAGKFFTKTLYSTKMRRLVRFLSQF